jgi:chloride channel protein, CIC family
MAATFNAPVTSSLLAVQLMLFEWRPRSYLPVTAAVAMATAVRGRLIGTNPLFPVNASLSPRVAGSTGTALQPAPANVNARIEPGLASFSVGGPNLGPARPLASVAM